MDTRLAGIAIDTWKQVIFERRLKDYKFETKPGLAEGTLIIYVYTNDLKTLMSVVQAANTEAAKVNSKHE